MILEQKSRYLNSIRVFPFFHPLTLLKKRLLPQAFSCEYCEISKNTFSNRTLPVAASERWKIVKPITLQRNLFTKVTGNRVSDHYARNFYVKVFLQIAVLWMLCHQKYFIKTTNSFENTYSKCGAGLQHGISPIVSFSRIFSKY